MSSRWAVMERYSPAAMEKEPATSPATPARRTNDPPGLAPGHAQDQGDVGHQAVADAEDGRPGTATADIPVLVDRHGIVLVRVAHGSQRSEVLRRRVASLSGIKP